MEGPEKSSAWKEARNSDEEAEERERRRQRRRERRERKEKEGAKEQDEEADKASERKSRRKRDKEGGKHHRERDRSKSSSRREKKDKKKSKKDKKQTIIKYDGMSDDESEYSELSSVRESNYSRRKDKEQDSVRKGKLKKSQGDDDGYSIDSDESYEDSYDSQSSNYGGSVEDDSDQDSQFEFDMGDSEDDDDRAKKHRRRHRKDKKKRKKDKKERAVSYITVDPPIVSSSQKCDKHDGQLIHSYLVQKVKKHQI